MKIMSFNVAAFRQSNTLHYKIRSVFCLRLLNMRAWLSRYCANCNDNLSAFRLTWFQLLYTQAALTRHSSYNLCGKIWNSLLSLLVS